MAETNDMLDALDSKIAELRAELDRLVAMEQGEAAGDENHAETVADVEVQLHAMIRKRKDLEEAA